MGYVDFAKQYLKLALVPIPPSIQPTKTKPNFFYQWNIFNHPLPILKNDTRNKGIKNSLERVSKFLFKKLWNFFSWPFL